jgi:hypothetical protein
MVLKENIFFAFLAKVEFLVHIYEEDMTKSVGHQFFINLEKFWE